MKERFESPPGLAAGEITATAFAKINLYLHVVGKRPDGYHLLDSLVVFAGIGDRITATAADGLALVIDGPFVDSLDKCRIGDNLVFRAAHRLAEEGGVRADASIRLEKNLPVAAGLGGGSADAAAALRALVTLWRLSAPAEDLARIALELGADVPVCLGGRAAFVSGIGERLAPAPKLTDAFAVLANPRRNLKTAGIFGDLRREEWSPASPFDAPPANAQALARLLSARRNDLEAAAKRRTPQIADVLGRLAKLPECLLARMSGSGATCFAVFADETVARAGARQLSLHHPGWWIRAAPLIYADNS